MGRPTLTTRTRSWLERVATELEDVRLRWLVFGGGLVLSLGLHLLLGQTQFAWAVAPLALVAGLTAGLRAALTVAGAAAVGHGIIDVVADTDPSEVLGMLVRTVALLFLAVAGTAGAQLERQRDRALHQAYSEDPVTGLLNVRVLYDEVDRLRSAGQPFAVLLADIRGMRRLNENYGHPTGTEAMRVLAHVLRRAAGKDVVASRLGSDEVAVVLVGEDRDQCRHIVADVIARLSHEHIGLPDGGDFEIHAAYGFARWPEHGEDAITLLRAADRAKQRAKAAGLDEVGEARSANGGRPEAAAPETGEHPDGGPTADGAPSETSQRSAGPGSA